jgi:hypothetical protein
VLRDSEFRNYPDKMNLILLQQEFRWPTRYAALSLFLTLLIACPPVIAQELSITEFMASNATGLRDEDGDFSDWIEIYNRSSEAASLAGFSLTDRINNLKKWTFPDTSIPPDTYLVVFASGKNRNPAGGGELHTNFQLSADGEFLALVGADGQIVSKFDTFPVLDDDVSFGRGVVTNQTIEMGLGTPCRWLIPDSVTNGWKDRDFDDSSWTEAAGGVGYDLSLGEDSYHELIGEGGDVLTAMRGINATCYARFPFQLEKTADIQRLILGMKYDDGFVAFLNGVEIARDLAPNIPSFATESVNARSESEVFEWNEFALSGFREFIVEGVNVLAIQGLNFGDQSSDFVVLPRMVVETLDPVAPELLGYFTEVTPGMPNTEPWEGIVGDTKFSHHRGFYRRPFKLSIQAETEGAQIWMTMDGSNPSPDNGQLYSEPIRLRQTTVLRVAAFRDRFAPSNIDTHTYLFPVDVAMQEEMDIDNLSIQGKGITDAIASLPAVSIAVRPADFFGDNGIYRLPNLNGRAAEVPISMEYFAENDPGAFQINAGIRIHGGNARDHPKKPFRLFFRSVYGAKRLDYPLFAGSDVESFDQLILRGFGHDGWALADSFGTRDEDIPPHAAFMRDQFLRKTENEMGLLSPIGKYVNVFVNGDYWGFYDLHERANAAFMEAHLGGEEGDYDVLHHPTFVDEEYTVVDGESTAWDELLGLTAAGIQTTSDYNEVQQYIDIDGLCDHMIVRMWSGDYDWCGPIFLPNEVDSVSAFSSKNWYTGRWSRNLPEGHVEPFRFWVWDAEMSMGLHLLRNLGFSWVFADQRELKFDLTQSGDGGSPTSIYSALRRSEEFQMRFGDRLQKHFGIGGALSVEVAQERLRTMAEEIQDVVVAESARWGDEGAVKMTKEEHWDSEVTWLEEQFIPRRLEIVRDQFKASGLYPEVDPPVLSLRGEVDAGESLTLTASDSGTIYYTIDGTDPLVPAVVDGQELIGESAPVAILIPNVENGGAAEGFEWRQLAAPSNIDQWMQGVAGIGYDEGTDYLPFIETDLESQMADVNASAFLRFEFDVAEDFDATNVSELSLEMRYDDGFVAYLNGTKVVGVSEPDPLTWNSFANTTHQDSQAVLFQPFDITSHLKLLVAGKNVLAVHFLNASVLSTDALLEPKLSVFFASVAKRPSPSARVYNAPIPINSDVNLNARVVSADGTWSALERTQLVVGRAPTSRNLVISQLHYRPLPPQGGAEMRGDWSSSDFEFIELMNVSDRPVKMADVSLTEGVRFRFPKRILGAGQRAVIVSKLIAFTARYGSALAQKIEIAGEYSGQLSNGGEFVELRDPEGAIIAEFRYQDSNGWPESADGLGYALVLANPFARQDPSVASHWIRSLDIHGSPGAAFTLTFAQWQQFYFSGAEQPMARLNQVDDDPDQDGATNGLEFAFGTDPLVANADTGRAAVFLDVVADGNGANFARIGFRARPEVSRVAYSADVSNNLNLWIPGGSAQAPQLDSDIEAGDGSRILHFRDPTNLNSPDGRYLRARADIPGVRSQ